MNYYPKKLTPEERESIDKQLGQISDRRIAQLYDLALTQVRCMRKDRGIASYRNRSTPFSWTPETIGLLGTKPDRVVAEKLNITPAMVYNKRTELKIKASQEGSRINWTPEIIALLGVESDRDIAKKLRVTKNSVRNKRINLGISPFKP